MASGITAGGKRWPWSSKCNYAAPSAFLASAASTLQLQQSILPEGIKDLTDQSIVSVENIWTSLSGSSVPTSESRHIQKAWDRPVAVNHLDQLLSMTSNEVDKARLLAATATHSVTGYKLHP